MIFNFSYIINAKFYALFLIQLYENVTFVAGSAQSASSIATEFVFSVPWHDILYYEIKIWNIELNKYNHRQIYINIISYITKYSHRCLFRFHFLQAQMSVLSICRSEPECQYNKTCVLCCNSFFFLVSW